MNKFTMYRKNWGRVGGGAFIDQINGDSRKKTDITPTSENLSLY